MSERKKFEVIKKISEILNKVILEKIILTVIDINLPKKGGRMKVHLSVFPENKTKEVVDYLNKISARIKSELKREVFLRYLPSKIHFYPSFEFKRTEEVLKLINETQSSKKKKGTED